MKKTNNLRGVNMTNEKKTLDQQFSEKSGIDVSKKKRGVDLNPVIGMGVTRSINCDSYPYTIIDILNVKGKKILKIESDANEYEHDRDCLLYTSPSPRDRTRSRMPSSA